MDKKPVLIKVGGHEIANHDFLAGLANVIANFDAPVVVVHGGGAEISQLQAFVGITPQYIDGLRVTDPASMKVVEMVLCGVVNKRLVRYLVSTGVEAVGMCGVDRSIVQAVKMAHPTQDMELTGEATKVRGDILLGFLEQGITPVIAPVCLAEDQPVTAYNVNADHVAGAVAAAIEVERVIFLTNVAGVLVNDVRVPQMSAEDAISYIEDGTIFGGMIPKVKTALDVLERGIPQAVITNLAGLQSHGGTVFTKSTMPTTASEE